MMRSSVEKVPEWEAAGGPACRSRWRPPSSRAARRPRDGQDALARIALHTAGRDPQLESENPKDMTTKFKLILGGILLLLGIIFAMQNSTVVEVRFLVWSIQMSQALVIFLTGAVGTVIGFLFGTAFKISRQS